MCAWAVKAQLEVLWGRAAGTLAAIAQPALAFQGCACGPVTVRHLAAAHELNDAETAALCMQPAGQLSVPARPKFWMSHVRGSVHRMRA